MTKAEQKMASTPLCRQNTSESRGKKLDRSSQEPRPISRFTLFRGFVESVGENLPAEKMN